MKTIDDFVTVIEDFPQKGVIFRDITTVIGSAEGLKMSVDGLVDLIGDTEFDVVAGTESRGFIFGAPVAYATGKGFAMARKEGKLPRETISEEYDLEYGSEVLEMHIDSISPGDRVVIIDDLIATGGTTEALVKLIEEMGGVVVKICFVIELKGLKGRERLKGYDVRSMVAYEGN